MGRGLTIYKGERGFGKTGHHSSEIKIIYTVNNKAGGKQAKK
jgi:PII-like signaling protein